MQDRNQSDPYPTNATDTKTAANGADGQQSAAQRRAGTDAATRDYQRDMQALDAAGTVDAPHDRKAGGTPPAELPGVEEPHDRKAGGSRQDGEEPSAPGADAADGRPEVHERRANDDGDDAVEAPTGTRGRDLKTKLKGNAVTLGLAATSISMLAGAGMGSGGGAKAVEVAATEGFQPPEVVSAQKGVTWDLHVEDHERVDFFKEFLMGRNYDKTRTWLERIGKYGPMIQNELRERGMPEDLLYLTMIESGLNPNAYSKADAAGLWQFIEETGERYGLEVTSHVDERRDPVKSTAAALTYLQKMHDRFDSWYLSAAGYNTGENRVGRLMRETTGSERGTDAGYWDIWDRLPSETRDYVPLMLAMGHIAKEPAKYGFHDLKYEEPLQFEEVTVPGGTKLADVAKTAGVDAEVVYDLNPHYVKKITPPNRTMAVRVPVGQGAQVASAFGGQQVELNVGTPAE